MRATTPGITIEYAVMSAALVSGGCQRRLITFNAISACTLRTTAAESIQDRGVIGQGIKDDQVTLAVLVQVAVADHLRQQADRMGPDVSERSVAFAQQDFDRAV